MGDVDQVESLTNILGCRIVIIFMLLKHLGLLLEASYKSIHIWDGVIKKTERQLANWKRLYPSKGGGVNLIKSTLANLPTYFVSISSSGKCRCSH